MNKANDPRNFDSQRRGLLAKVHIAIKELGLDDNAYRVLLAQAFGVKSSKDLRLIELERLISHFESCGWVPRPKRGGKKSYLVALRERIQQVAQEAHFTGKRLRDLCRFACQVDDPAWCKDTEKLKRLLAILTKYEREERDGRSS